MHFDDIALGPIGVTSTITIIYYFVRSKWIAKSAAFLLCGIIAGMLVYSIVGFILFIPSICIVSHFRWHSVFVFMFPMCFAGAFLVSFLYIIERQWFGYPYEIEPNINLATAVLLPSSNTASESAPT